MMAKPVRVLELRYPMILFLTIIIYYVQLQIIMILKTFGYANVAP